jgi:NADPH:quinone reductase-like Zn-dependent oxidoreductase
VVPVAYVPGLAERVRDAAPSPVTAAQDNIGGDTVEVALSLGLPPDRICTIADDAAVERWGVLTPGRYTRSTGTLEQLAGLCAAGELSVPIVARFPLDRVGDGFRELAGSHAPGKIVIEVS